MTNKIFKIILLLSVIISLAGCEIAPKKKSSGHHVRGPHSTKAKHGHESVNHSNKLKKHKTAKKHVSYRKYYYYPNLSVYYDRHRKVFYYISGKSWKVSKRLPKRYKLTKYRISLKMKTKKPYLAYKRHRKKYPRKHTRKIIKKVMHNKPEENSEGGTNIIQYNKNIKF